MYGISPLLGGSPQAKSRILAESPNATNRMRLYILPAMAALLLSLPLAAQNPRASTQVDTTSTGTGLGPAVATDGNLSAVVYNDGSTGGSNTVNVVTSDARGLTWSAPTVVDADITAARKFTQRDSVAVIGNSIYVAWEDERNGASNEDLFFNYSDDGGATWAGEVMIDKGYPAATGAVRDWRMVVQEGSPNMVYFLISTDPTTSANEELYVSSSLDGGATFSAAVPVSSAGLGTADVDGIDLAAQGMTLHVAFVDNRSGVSGTNEVWYQQSTDGGATWLGADVQIDSSGLGVGDAQFDPEIATFGTNVALAFQEELTSATNEELRMAVSNDGGTTWGADVMIGGYDPTLDDLDNMTLAATGFGMFAAAWEDNRTGADEIYVATSMDAGASWTESPITTAGGGFPRIIGSDDGSANILGVAWTSGAFPNTAQVSFTWNSGNSWSTPVDVSDNAGFDVDFHEMALNGDYNNFICAWLSDDLGTNHVYVGGLRSATLTVNGIIRGGVPVNFDMDFFSFDSGGFAGVLISGGTGSFPLPFGDGRETGLLNDAILTQSIANNPGVLTAGITATGSGTTPLFPWPGTLPVGTPLYLVAVGFDPSGGVTLGNITDIVEDMVQ
ncbi:MAG: exo-alpha-sialidase [Planctomycetota bacterium]|nr:MAG: exo-alpha-sialidase [Planctomycetota bacterium]